MSISRRLSLALLCAFSLCLTGSSFAQTVNYGGRGIGKGNSEAQKSLLAIESKLEAVLDLLPRTIGGKALEDARSQINASFKTVVHAFKEAEAEREPSGELATTVTQATKLEQPTKELPVGRYQISSWTRQEPNGSSTVGAFIINTQTGMVWKIDGSSQAVPYAQVTE